VRFLGDKHLLAIKITKKDESWKTLLPLLLKLKKPLALR
jgi:hypothetical protein